MDTLHGRFARDGFVLLKDAIPSALMEDLRAAVVPVLQLRAGGATRYQTILDERFFSHRYIYFLNLPALNRAAQAIIGREDLIAGGLALQIGSATRQWLGWHRDHGEQSPDLPARFAYATKTIQTNCPLYDDDCLWVIPGSQRRPSTAEELAHRGDPAAMPGAFNVQLRAGDCLLYQPIIWHAAEYRPEWKRATFHGGWMDPEMVDRFATCRWGFDKHPSLIRGEHLGELGPYYGPQLARYRAAALRYLPDLARVYWATRGPTAQPIDTARVVTQAGVYTNGGFGGTNVL